jgi:UDP-N-acetyl-D-mannosaminuronic acid dehydrogenase
MAQPDLAQIGLVPRSVTETPKAARPDIVVLGGGGHAGLPLSLLLARAGLTVGILDASASTLDAISSGRMPFMEAGADDLLGEILPTGRLVLDGSPSLVEGVGVVIIVVGTPVDEFMNPSMTLFDRVIDDLEPHLARDALLVLRSTVYPGTTTHVRRRLEPRRPDVRVAFCPERIAEGHALEELGTLPQIVGADDEETTRRARAVFERLGTPIVTTTAAEAELAKLFTNAWRYMKFAVANQFFMIANDAGQDYGRILDAIRRDYPRALDLPGPGFAAGPCLLKDTMQLAAFTPGHFPMGQSARQVNEGLPAYLVSTMERRWGDLTGRKVGILGMAFKAESDDPRDSLSYKLRKLLGWAGATALCTDPYVADERLMPLEDVLEGSEILVVGAPHRRYREIELPDKPLVDIWGIGPRGITA